MFSFPPAFAAGGARPTRLFGCMVKIFERLESKNFRFLQQDRRECFKHACNTSCDDVNCAFPLDFLCAQVDEK